MRGMGVSRLPVRLNQVRLSLRHIRARKTRHGLYPASVGILAAHARKNSLSAINMAPQSRRKAPTPPPVCPEVSAVTAQILHNAVTALHASLHHPREPEQKISIIDL